MAHISIWAYILVALIRVTPHLVHLDHSRPDKIVVWRLFVELIVYLSDLIRRRVAVTTGTAARTRRWVESILGTSVSV